MSACTAELIEATAARWRRQDAILDGKTARRVLGRRAFLGGSLAAAALAPFASRVVFAAARSSLEEIASIPASACGMDPSLNDNSAALARGLANFQGIIDGGGRTYKFTQAGGPVASSGGGILDLVQLKGVKGLSNMTLDFSACTGDWKLLGIAGMAPGAPVALSANANAGTLTLSVASAASFNIGQPVVLNSNTAWCSNYSGPTTNEFNRVVAIAGTTLTLQSPLLNNYLTSASAVVLPLYTDSSVPAGWSPLKFILDQVTIIGSGASAPGGIQIGCLLRYTVGSYINATVRDCPQSGIEFNLMNLDAAVPYVKGTNINATGYGYTLVAAGSARIMAGTVISQNSHQAIVFKYASGTFGGTTLGLVGRDSHCNAAIAQGNAYIGAAVYAGPGSANSWVDYAEVTSSPNTGSDYAVNLQGYQQGVGRVVCPASAITAVALQYFGGRDASNFAWYRFGSIDVGTVSGAGSYAFNNQCNSADATRPVDLCFVGSITAAAVPRGVGIDASAGPIGVTDIGPSTIKTTGTGTGSNTGEGLYIKATGSYPIIRVRMRDSLITTSVNSANARPIEIVTTGNTPEVNLSNIVTGGGDYGMYISNARVFLSGECKFTGWATDNYFINTGSYLTVFDEAPAARWAPSGTSSFTLRCSKTEILPTAGGYTLTLTIPAAFNGGQEFGVDMLANGATSTVWTSPDATPINGAPSSMAAYSSARFRLDASASSWQRVRV